MCSTVEQHRLMSDGKMRNPVKRANLQSAQRPLSISWTPREIGTLGLGAVFLGSFLQIVYYEHYAAPAAAAMLLVLVQSLRHLRHLRAPPQGAGRGLRAYYE